MDNQPTSALEQQMDFSNASIQGPVLIGQAGHDLHQTLTVQVGDAGEMATILEHVSQWTTSGSVAWSKQEFDRRRNLLQSVKKIWITDRANAHSF